MKDIPVLPVVPVSPQPQNVDERCLICHFAACPIGVSPLALFKILSSDSQFVPIRGQSVQTEPWGILPIQPHAWEGHMALLSASQTFSRAKEQTSHYARRQGILEEGHVSKFLEHFWHVGDRTAHKFSLETESQNGCS